MNRGFTLIEMIIYVALFAILMSGATLTTYQIMQASAQTQVKGVVQDEEAFVLGKIEWVLASIDPSKTYSPSSGTSNTLSLTRYGSTNVIKIRQNGAAVEMSEDGGVTYTPITTSNVSVSSLTFTYVAPTGTGPAGITASMTIKNPNDTQTFTVSTTRYVRK